MWGYVCQGKAYEGLTCNALEWVTSFGGGTIVDADGKVTIDNPRRRGRLDDRPPGSARSRPRAC